MEEQEKKPNKQLRRERELRGWSQRKVADILGTNEQVVNRWESGQHKPNRHFQTQLCQLFEKSAEELGFMGEPHPSAELTENPSLPPTPQGITGTEQEQGRQDIDKLRRQLLEQTINVLCTALILPTYGSLYSDRVDSFLSDPVQSLSIKGTTPETLEDFAALTEICRHLSEGNELRMAERILWSYLPRVETIAKLSFEHERMAANVASQGYLLAASLAGHRNDLQARHHLSQQALLYGKLAQDHNLQITALRQLSITFDYLERPDKVLQIYQQTFPHLNDTSPLLQACIYAGVSGAYAQLKQKQEALRFIALAYEHFPANPESEPSFLHTICRYSTLVFFDGLNHLDLGQPDEAEKVLARIDGLEPKVQIPERVRVELLNYQIEVFIVLGQMEQACTYLEAAVKASLAIGSEKRFQESLTLFQQMQKIWRNELRVQQLEGLFIR